MSRGKTSQTSWMVPQRGRHFKRPHPVSVSIMDGGPFSAVVAESQEVGRHVVTPETRQYVGNTWNWKTRYFRLFCVLLIQGVSSLCYDCCELCVPASVQLKPVDPVFRVRTPCSTSHVIFIIWALETTEATTHATGSLVCKYLILCRHTCHLNDSM